MTKAIQDEKEDGFVEALDEVDKAAIPFAGDKNPLVFRDAKDWEQAVEPAGRSSPADGRAAAFGAGNRNREEAAHAGLAAIHQCPAEQSAGLPGQVGGGQHVPRPARAWPKKA